jgi:PAS domain-containing protein
VDVLTERAERLVEGIAKQAAIAIDNARLFEAIQKRRTQAEESEKRFRAIVETAPECVKLVASDGTLLHMNSIGLSMVHADSSESVIGKCVYDLIAPEDRERYSTGRTPAEPPRTGREHPPKRYAKLFLASFLVLLHNIYMHVRINNHSKQENW